jgi:hypothetical protein
MRGLRERAALVLGVSIATGCALVTGSTDGYRAAEAGAGSACGDGGEGGCGASNFACVSAADCGDGGDVCCFVAGSSVGTACQVGPCSGELPIQLCRSTSECGDAGSCALAACSLGGSSLMLQVCGAVPVCGAPP